MKPRKMWQLSIVFLTICTEAVRRSDKQDQLDDVDVDVIPEHFSGSRLFGNVYKDGRVGKGHDDPAQEITFKPETEKEFMQRQGLALPGYLKPFLNQFIDDADEATPKQNSTDSENRARMWFNFPAMHEQNLKLAGTHLKDTKTRWRSNVVAPTPKPPPMVPYFDKRHFHLRKNETVEERRFFKKRLINWTDCNEFGRGAKFNPNDIVDLDWVPFFVWSTTGKNTVACIHRFTKPTLKIAQEFQTKYGPFVNNSVNWEHPKLFLTVRGIGEFLLVATDTWGVFMSILRMELPESIKEVKNPLPMPIKKVRLKIEDPYLVLMECDDELAVIMALDGQEPATAVEKKLEADTIGFQGVGYPVSRDLDAEALLQEQRKEKVYPHQKKMLKVSMDHGIIGSDEESEEADKQITQGKTRRLDV